MSWGFHARVFFCSKDATPKHSPSGSVSDAPKKSSKKSKKSKDNMTKVYTSVLDSVFGAVRKLHPPLSILMRWFISYSAKKESREEETFGAMTTSVVADLSWRGRGSCLISRLSGSLVKAYCHGALV